MTFPEDDRFWTGALAVVRELGSPDAILLAPHEFMEKLANARPAQFSFFLKPQDVDTVIVHKGKTGEYHQRFLDAFIENSRYSTANEVFALFSNAPGAPAERHNSNHLQSLIDHLRSHTRNASIDRAARRGVQSEGRSLWSRRKQTSRRFLICSASGFGNLGDDAVTQALADSVREVEPSAEVVITSPPPQRKCVEDADVVLVGGGGLFYDRDFPNAVNYTQYLLWAHELGKPALVVGVGTQGIRTEAGRRLFREALDPCRLITVRDENDRDVLKKRVGVRPPVHVTRDLAFLVEQKPCPALSKAAKPSLLIAFGDEPRLRPYQDTVESCIAPLKQSFDVHLMLQSRYDTALYRRLAEQHRLDTIDVIGDDAGCARTIYGSANLVITSRYHGLIFAALAGVPVVPVGRHGGKIHQLVSHGLPSLRPAFIVASEFTIDRLERRVREFQSGLIRPADVTELQVCISSARANLSLLRGALSR